ncbi:Large-conductance mechanosensitive channel [bioreactor metagenome]|uniref:Large-conductance mechanosensitive channel n=1 Tax=bioreactor metagenome TaxID=1076179 RepID=A0A644WD31_9ZZZZ|nr:large conductance mechanosensitive channel protein MscL [Acidaminococcaceae bacterium]
MSFFKEFRTFALKGNVMDMAVGVIIGAAFSKIVSSLVTDIIMPPIGKVVGNIDFSNLFINLSDKPVTTLAEATKMKVPVIAYGLFLTNIIYFLIIAFVIFILVSQLNKLKREEVQEAARLCPYCKSEIAKDATRCPHCTSQLKD